MLNGDEIFFCKKPASLQIKNIAQKNNSLVVSYKTVAVHQSKNFGMIQTKNKNSDEVVSIIEKPKNNKTLTKAVVGRYILDDHIFPILQKMKSKNKEIYLTLAINQLAKKQKTLCCKINGKRFDCGCTEGVYSANKYLFEKLKKK